jgi:hypothetical protein
MAACSDRGAIWTIRSQLRVVGSEWKVFDVGTIVRVADLRCTLRNVSAHSY